MGEETAVINNKQFRDILICITWPTIINYGSGFLVREVGRDMWISGIISVLTAVPFILVIINIGKSFPGKTIVEYSSDLLGNIPAKLLGFILTAYFLIYAVNSVSMYIHHLTAFLLPETPFIVVTVLHVIVVCYMVWKGPEVIARMGVIGFSLATVFYILVYLASLSEIDIDRILPIFESGIIPILSASIKADTFTGVIHILVAMLLPMVSIRKKALRASIIGLTIGGFFFVSYFIVELMVMGPQTVAIMRIASMDFVRSIQITQYLHRFESFMVALWYWSILVQAGIFASCSLEAFRQTTKMKKSPWSIIALGIFLIVFTNLIGRDRVFFLNFREYQWQYFALPIQYGIPIMLLIALIIKKALAPAKKQK